MTNVKKKRRGEGEGEWANWQSEREKESGLLTTANHERETYKQERWLKG